jgi:hypothetical protein
LYAYHEGNLINVNSLFTRPITQIPWGDGNIVLSLPPTGIPGDVNFDGATAPKGRARDVDLEQYAVAGAVLGKSKHAFFDLNLDGNVTQADTDYLVRVILNTEYGDTNLDGKVDILDLNTLAAYWGEAGCVSWSDGDFNGDWKIDILDLNAMAAHWGFPLHGAGGSFEEALATTSIPEPIPAITLLLGASAILARRQGRPRRPQHDNQTEIAPRGSVDRS